MKKLLSIAVCASAVAAFADPTTINVGSVGVTEIQSSLTNTVIAVSYAELGTDGTSGIAVSNIVKTANLTVGDLLHVFKTSNTYETYRLTAGAGGAKYWDKTVNYLLNANGVLTAGESSDATIPSLTAGVGIWLVRNVAEWDGQPFTFHIYGQPVSTPTFSASAGTANLIGNPTQTAKVPSFSVTTQGDRVLVPDESVLGGLKTYKYSTKGGWTTVNVVDGVRTRDSGLPTIAAGKGFWYVPVAASTVSWANN